MGSYRMRFVSQEGSRYELRMWPTAEGYDAEGAQELTGGAEPFVTEEEDGEDILQAVRSSTGYISIVTEDYKLQEKIVPGTADGMRVQLVRHAMADETDQKDRVMWEGYVQPTAYSQDWSAGPWEIQVPVVSRLGMVMDDYLSSGNTGLLTVREWLARICGDVYKSVLIPADELSAPGTMPWGADTLPTPTVLQLAFSEERFKSRLALQERENKQNTISGMWEPGSNRDIATSLCTAFRWVLREDGDTLICDDPGTTAPRYLRYTVAELQKSSPTASEVVLLSDVRIEEMGGNWADVQLGGNDGKRDIIKPLGKVSVEGASDKYETTLISIGEDWEKAGGLPLVNGGTPGMNRPDTLPFDLYGDSSVTILSQKVADNVELEVFRYMNKALSVQTSNGSASYSEGVRMDGPEDPAYPGVRTLGETSMVYGCAFPYVVFGTAASQLSHGDYFGGGEVAAIHYHYERDNVYTHHRLNSVILGKLDTSSQVLKPAVKLRTTLAQLLPYSSRKKAYPCLKISGMAHRGRYYQNVDMADECDGDGLYGIQVSVKVGDVYITKDTWGSHQCSLTKTETPFDILWTKHSKNGFGEYIRLGMTDGFPMALDAPIEVTIYTPTNAPRQNGRTLANNCKWLRIDNFSVEVTEQEDTDMYDFNPTLVDEPNSGISLSERIGDNKLEEYELSTQLGGADNPGALMAAIPVTIAGMETSMMQARKVGTLEGDNDGARYLCKRTWEWMKTQGRSTRVVLTVPLRGTRPWSFPEPMRVGDAERGYMPVAKRRNWRDDLCEMKMVEILM